MSSSTPTSPEHRIRRKPPPALDISERYPSPDPLDPFAPLWVLRNRTSSGLSTQDVLDSNILSRARTTSYLYSTTTAQVSVNTSVSPIHSPSQKSKIGHYRPYSQTTFIDSPQVFPLISSPLASQQNLLYYHQPDRRSNVRSPRHTFDMYDSSGTESDTPSVPFPSHKPAFIQPMRTASSNHRLPSFLLLRKSSFLGSGKPATGNRSSMIEFKQIQTSDVSPPVVSTLTWMPNPISSDSIIGQSASKLHTSFSADSPDHGSLTLTSDENIPHQHHKRHLMTSDVKKEKDLKQDSPRPRKLPSIPLSPKMLRKRISSGMPFSSHVTASTRSTSTSSYIHISMPMPVPSSSQPTSEDAYTSPRKAPVPPPVSATIQASGKCVEKPCADICTHSTSSEWDIPTLSQLNHAASLPITGDDGKQITFGSLFESQRTVVIFIRHFWCPLCQDYMSSVKSSVRPEMVSNNCEGGGSNNHYDRSRNQNYNGTIQGSGGGIRFAVIGNGAHGMIAKYRQIFGLPFKVYTDPTLTLYQALGMSRGCDIKHHNHRTHRYSTPKRGPCDVTSEKNSDIRKDGGYVKHSLMGGIAMVVIRALKVCMPVWEKGGDINQLGGEFIFGPGLTCTYAHRMQTTKGHAPIQDVLQAAGISVPNRTPSSAEPCRRSRTEPTMISWPTSLTSETGLRRRRESMKTSRDKESSQVNPTRRHSRRYSIGMMSQEEEDQWMEYRQNSIERLQEKKNTRRGMSRAGSSQSHWTHQALEMSLSEMGDHDQDDHTEERGQFTRATDDSEGECFSPTPTLVPTSASDDISCLTSNSV